MAASIENLAPDNATDATFRAWGSVVSAKLAAMGLVQTADTDQINWATVVRAAINTVAGYEIWGFNDTLQATKPIFIKVEYGAGTTQTYPLIWIQCGTATNGAGTLTGGISTRYLIGVGSTSTSAEMCVFSGSTNRLMMALFTAVYTHCIMVSIERTKDSAGADTGDGLLIAVSSTNNGIASARQEYYQWNVGTSGSEADLGILYPKTGTGSSGTDIAVYPVFFSKGVFLYPGMNLLGYFTANITAGITTTIPIYGSNHVYYPLNLPAAVVSRSVVSGTGLLLRYE